MNFYNEVKRKLKEAENLSQSELEEYAQYLYEEADGEVSRIPSYEETNDWIFGVDKRNYNKIYKMVKTAIENVAGNFYNDKIELSDNHTLWNLRGNFDNATYFEEDYADVINKAFEGFQNETGVEIWQDGRSGRHIVVDDNFYNAYHYAELCDAQEKWENWVIDEIESRYPEN